MFTGENMKKIIIGLLLLSNSLFAGTVTEREVIENYAELVYQTYSKSLVAAEGLQNEIHSFLNNPSETTLENAKKAWIMARAPYGQSEVFRFYNGPIDQSDGPEGLLNAWPLDEAYIDYVVGQPNSGIINNQSDYPQITKDLLSNLNELNGEKNISTGYHAIEFLLWGQDLSDISAGNRPYTDFVVGVGQNAQRRREYLSVAVDLLIDHLTILVIEWAPNEANYRMDFVAKDSKIALKNILSGIIYMIGDELSGERMYVAWETMGQEDEHSCFSDMTHMDIQWNYWGVENILRETNLLSLNEAKKFELNIMSQVNSIHSQLANIPVPFDQAILSSNGRDRILTSVESMEALTLDFVNLSKDLNAPVQW